MKLIKIRAFKNTDQADHIQLQNLFFKKHL